MLSQQTLTDCILACTSEVSSELKNNQILNGPDNNRNRQQKPTAKIRLLRAHKIILSASSEFFSQIFTSLNSHQKTSHSNCIVVIDQARHEDLESILEFIYAGEVAVGHDQVHSFLSAAKMLDIKGLNNIKLVAQDGTSLDEDPSTLNIANQQKLKEVESELARFKEENERLRKLLKTMKMKSMSLKQNQASYEQESIDVPMNGDISN